MPIHAPPTRAATLKRLAQHRFDLLVIGGGINGAGIARDAARRGLDVALLERGDFASGTSSRSSRLVHGGVRYLEHGHVRLVFEASRERRTLLRIAPHLVRPLRFTWPVYAGARIPRWKLLAGLWLYDLLALFRNVGRHQARSASEITALEPALAAQALRGGATYFDAATDDARLTIATLLDAARAGATVLNHADVTTLRVVDGIAAGATATDRRGGGTFDVSADCVVSATGPWTDAIRALESPGAPASVHGTKGVHIAVPRQRVGNREAITLLAPDGRVMFALPAGPCTIFGTTDTVTRESPDDVCASVADIDYLLAAANRFFPHAALTAGDVISAWAGIRPLIAGPADRAPTSASREHAIAIGPRGVITVTGGKLTTYRVVAADAVDAVLRRLGRRASGSHTDHLPLPGGTIGSVDAERIAAHAATRDTAVGDRLVRAYGAEWRDVWAHVGIDAALAVRLDPTLPYIGAEVHHAVTREFACTIADVLVRRTPLAFETRDHGASAAPRVAAIMAPLHGWTDRGISDALAEYHAEVTRLFRIAR